jgi:hypothetical protein
MTSQPPYESLEPDESLVIKLIDNFYTEAYGRHINKENPISVSMGVGGYVETIALNPMSEAMAVDNVRFLVATGSIDFGGFSMNIDEEELNVKYVVIKITLAPDDKRSIEELVPEQLNLATLFFISDDGRVSNGNEWFADEETNTLISLMEVCELAPSFPEWAQDHED